MTRAAVRAAIQSFAVGLAIPNVGTVYKDAPWWLPDININGAAAVATDPSSLYGAALFVHLMQDTESRITVPALAGNKVVTYGASIGIVYRYMIPNTLPAGQIEDAWVLGLDAIIDALKAGIRAAPTLGANASVIFQAGQQDEGIKIVQDLPVIDNGSFVRCLARLDFTVDEIIVA